LAAGGGSKYSLDACTGIEYLALEKLSLPPGFSYIQQIQAFPSDCAEDIPIKIAFAMPISKAEIETLKYAIINPKSPFLPWPILCGTYPFLLI
jgi:hypothetical protein